MFYQILQVLSIQKFRVINPQEAEEVQRLSFSECEWIVAIIIIYNNTMIDISCCSCYATHNLVVFKEERHEFIAVIVQSNLEDIFVLIVQKEDIIYFVSW